MDQATAHQNLFMEDSSMQTIRLNNGNFMPDIAYGTWKIENGATTTEAVLKAISLGYRHIDTAASYGNDFAVGKALKKSVVCRDELFITNKLWNTCMGYKASIDACKRTLKLMKLEYLDAYLIHWPASISTCENWEKQNLDTWRGLEQLQKEGYIVNIGVSNFLPAHLEAILRYGSVKPTINQFEMHPGKRQDKTIEFCKEHNICPMAWSPMGHGALLEQKTISRIAKEKGKSPAQICLRYVLEKNMALVTRSIHEERMIENMSIYDFELSDEEVEELDQLEGIGDAGLHPDDPELEKKLQEWQ